MTSDVYANIQYAVSNKDAGGLIKVDKVRVERFSVKGKMTVDVTLSGTGYLQKFHVRMQPELAKILASLLTSASDGYASLIESEIT